MNNIDLSELEISKKAKDLEHELAGTKDSKYGKIIGSKLLFKGRISNITHVGENHLECDGGIELFGQWGDEFPLHLVR